MSQQGPIVIVSNQEDPTLAAAMAEVRTFPLIDVNWADAADAVARLQPAAIIVSATNGDALNDLAWTAANIEPYTPLIAIDHGPTLPPNVLPFARSVRTPERLVARLNAALRVRALHATMLRRSSAAGHVRLPASDPLQDATALLIGRGGTYPALSVALGERMGVVGALSIEAAARHLNARDLDGIIIGEGFTARVIDAFLTVLSEDSRFRNLPVVVAGAPGLTAFYDLPNLEIISGEPLAIVDNAVPLIRQHAFEARIDRVMKSIDAGGLLDPRTGLLTPDAFRRDFDAAVTDTLARGAGLSVARITFAPGATSERVRMDAARILSRLMRRMDFATLHGSDAIVIVLAETSLRNAHMIARRLGSVLKHTMHSPGRHNHIDPHMAVATLMQGDTAASILSRLHSEGQRAAS
ncbi:MAG TPA: GGDEF domain-containing protein [Afipia sp.]